MERTEEKLKTFEGVVLTEAARKKAEIVREAEQNKKDSVESAELSFLKQAHDRIQESIRKMGKASNEEVSRTIVESKQALFTRREEIIDLIFVNLRKRLEDFRRGTEYAGFLERRMVSGMERLGNGDIRFQVDDEDVEIAKGILAKLELKATVETAEDILGGGCLVINKTTGRMFDLTLERSLEVERNTFLEHYELSIEG